MNAYVSPPPASRSVTLGRRRGRPPGSAKAAEVALPDPSAVPTWSEPTLAALSQLTALQRAYVQWIGAGCTGSEAYRRGSRRTGMLGANARNNARQLARNPKVRAAIQAVLADQSVGPLMDREFLFQRLCVAIEKAEECDGIAAAGAVARLIRLVAELRGELGRW